MEEKVPAGFEASCNGFNISGTVEPICNCGEVCNYGEREKTPSICQGGDFCKQVTVRFEHVATGVVFEWKTYRILFNHEGPDSDAEITKDIFEGISQRAVAACSIPKDDLPLYINDIQHFQFKATLNLRMLHGV